MPAPLELIDPEGEGIYLSHDDYACDGGLGILHRAMFILGLDHWREVEHRTAFMYPKNDGSDEWFEIPWTLWWRWRFNIRRFSPVAYAYCTPGVSSPHAANTDTNVNMKEDA